MYQELQIAESPQWSAQAGRRLRVSLLLSVICISTVLSVLRFPVVGQTLSFTELVVKIIWEESAFAEPRAEKPIVDEPAADEAARSEAPRSADTPSDAALARPDWYASIRDAAKAALDNAPRTYSVNPVFDEKRRKAARQYYASRAPVQLPTWENVEKDQLGRSLLWSGDCYRVVGDPNVGSREAFETFGQYITYCMNWKESPQELPWVSEIRNRRASLARSVPPAAE